ncbi:MAG: GNAT family N-acetyltransferase [Ruminococcus sp.]|nr:GNAT family N-acetyltransferase [Ruminococcus sp.]
MKLIKATVNDAKFLWEMQKESFASLLEKYQDFDTSPASEPLEKTIFRLDQPETYYYIIEKDGEVTGAIRIIDKKDGETRKRISPLYILPKFRNKGFAQQAIIEVEKIHGAENWELDTILEEKGNCYLYEKMGYSKTGKTTKINDKLTLVFYCK